MYNKINDIIFLQSINSNDNVTCDLTSTAFEERHLAVEQIKWLKAVKRGEIKSTEFNTPRKIDKAIKEEKKNKERAELEIYKYIQYLKKRYDGVKFQKKYCTEILDEFLKTLGIKTNVKTRRLGNKKINLIYKNIQGYLNQNPNTEYMALYQLNCKLRQLTDTERNILWEKIFSEYGTCFDDVNSARNEFLRR